MRVADAWTVGRWWSISRRNACDERSVTNARRSSSSVLVAESVMAISSVSPARGRGHAIRKWCKNQHETDASFIAYRLLHSAPDAVHVHVFFERLQELADFLEVDGNPQMLKP